MGIPKFYRWLSERYPLLNMPVTATEAPPEIDNLYLDMNGIIHNCTHANDPNLKLTETEMVLRVFNYLDKLIQIMKPKKLVFLAIDGVAPRAKMNQQRSRRFKSALERLAREAEQKAQGNETPEEYKFDSNCITPGTAFMARLGKHLRFFIRKKISEDPTWQQPVVIFSGHDVPGEGEHKIMEYIRWQKRSASYTPNERHCMYGLDADLIMLSLVTHEPHFCLLREVVSFSGKNRGQPSRETLENPCAENFILFQIGLLREYIELEFNACLADKQLTFALDVERVVDDIVLFCMLVGNDFLPALPTLDIAEGALNKLIEMYKQLLPQMGGYLTYAGDLNHERLQLLLGVLADAELQTLEERAADTEWFENKRQKRGGCSRGGLSQSSSRPQTASAAAVDRAGGCEMAGYGALEELGDLEELSAAAVSMRSREPVVAALAAVVPALPELELELEPEEAETGPTMMSKEARALFLNGGGELALKAWKERYYKEKLEVRDASPACTQEVVHHYIRGLHWVLQYYYRGVASWDWFYPYHYAPMASDMRSLEGVVVRFNRGKPFKPFEQLLAVLPAASASLLPEPFQWLMTDTRSPILDFYPEKFDVDMEGKRAEWEGVVKVPFIDEQRLLAAAASIPMDSLTAEERKRNVPGDMLVFEYAAGSKEPEHCDTTLPHHFSTIVHAHSTCRHVPPPEPIPVQDRGFVPQLAKGTLTGKKNPPGFPTLKTMSKLQVELKLAGVNVFGNPAKKDSLILQLPDVRSTIGADAAAPLLRAMLCGRVYVKWPYLQEAEIMAVSDSRQRITVEGLSQHTPEEASKWQMVAGQTKNMFLTKSGIDIGPLPIMLDVRVCTGYVRAADGTCRKEYHKDLVPYPLQAVLQSRPKPPAGFADPDAPKQLSLQAGSRVVWVGANYFGCLGSVLADPGIKVSGQPSASGHLVRVQPLHRELLLAEGRARHIVQQYAQEYLPSGLACRQLRVNPRMLGRLTGNVWVDDSKGDRVDVGLAVKNAKQGLCVPSLCRPAPEGNGWSYAVALVDIVREYKARFPSVLAALEPSASAAPATDGSLEAGGARQRLTAEALFPGVPAELLDQKLQEVRKWLQGLSSAKRPLVAMTSQQASDMAVDRLQIALPGLLPVGSAGVDSVDLEQVPSSLLLPPHDPSCPISVLAGGSFEPGDRVVVLRGTGVPAFGARGTIIGVLSDGLEVLMDHEFAGGSTLGGRLRSARGAYLPPEQLLNVSKQQPVRGSGQKPRPVPANSRHRVLETAAAAAAAGEEATSPRTAAAAAAARLVALAPWVKGKQLHQVSAREREQQGGPSQPGGPQAPQLGAVVHADVPAAAPVPPTTQGTKLLQLLNKQILKKQQLKATGPGAVSEPTTTVASQLARPQQQHMQQDKGVELGISQVTNQPPAARQAQQPPQRPPATGTVGPPGQSLLRRLQKVSINGAHTAATAASSVNPLSQQQPEQQQHSSRTHKAPSNGGVADAGHIAQGQPSGTAGAHLLALLQRPAGIEAAASATSAAASTPDVGAYQQQQQLAREPAVQDEQQQQQRQQQKVLKQPAVKVVPRPKKQPEAPQPQMALTPPQQQQHHEHTPVIHYSGFAMCQQQKEPTPVVHYSGFAMCQDPNGQQLSPTPQQQQQQQPPVPAAVAVPPVKVANSMASRSASQGSDDTGVKPRTPPAGAGASLLSNRGQTVIQARLPDGTRGFTMGRGQRRPAAAGGAAQQAPAAPGSNSGGLAAVPPAGDAPGARSAAVLNAPGHVQSGFALVDQPAVRHDRNGTVSMAMAATAGDGAGAGHALMKLLQRGNAVPAQSLKTKFPQQVPAPAAQQQPPPQPSGVATSGLALHSPGPSRPAAPAVDAVTAANTNAASNLLRRLQQQHSGRVEQ